MRLSVFFSVCFTLSAIVSTEAGAQESMLPATVVSSFERAPVERNIKKPQSISAAAVVVLSRPVEIHPLSTSVAEEPSAATVIPLDSLVNSHALLNINEPLKRVPGIKVWSSNNYSQDTRVSVRGFGTRSAFGMRGVRLYLEGIPLTLADGQSFLDSIDLSSAESVEVTRAASAARYGGASGGAIHIRLRDVPNGSSTEQSFSAGSYGFQQWRSAVSHRDEKSFWELRFSDTQVDGWREQSSTGIESLLLRGGTQISDHTELSIIASYVDSPWSGDPGGLKLAELQDDPRQAAPNNKRYRAGEAVRDTLIGISAETLLRENTVETSVFLNQRDFANRLPFRNGGAVSFNREFYGGAITVSRDLESGAIAGGIDVSVQKDRRKRFDNNFGTIGDLKLDQREQVTQIGAFLQKEWELSPDLTLSSSVRFQSNRYQLNDEFLVNGNDSGQRSFNDLTGNLGFVYDLSPAVSLFGGFHHASDAPTTTELLSPTGQGLNANLQNASSNHFELGLRGTVGRSAFELAAFHIRTENELIPFELSSSPGRRFFRNAGETERFGVEFQVESQITEQLSFLLSGSSGSFTFDSFTDSSGVSLAGNELAGVYQHNFFSELRYQTDSGWTAALDVEASYDAFADDRNQVKAPDHFSLNASLSYRHNFENGWVVTPWVRATNLTGESNLDNLRANAGFGRYFEAAPGAAVEGGVKVSKAW